MVAALFMLWKGTCYSNKSTLRLLLGLWCHNVLTHLPFTQFLGQPQGPWGFSGYLFLSVLSVSLSEVQGPVWPTFLRWWTHRSVTKILLNEPALSAPEGPGWKQSILASAPNQVKGCSRTNSIPGSKDLSYNLLASVIHCVPHTTWSSSCILLSSPVKWGQGAALFLRFLPD